MSKYVLGGNRVGSGSKMKGYMHEYNRSTHNLSERWASSMASGILYPAMCKIATRGDSFDIDIAADLRTIPTLTPLFGSYKMQIDVYQAPIRLYQAILHNNPLAIGLNMGQVKFPRLKIEDDKRREDSGKMNESCLLKYLGLSGLGKQTKANTNNLIREVNALPILAYYDIFKTYYANKQEEKAYVISAERQREYLGSLGNAGEKNIQVICKTLTEYISWWNNDDDANQITFESLNNGNTINLRLPITKWKEFIQRTNLNETMIGLTSNSIDEVITINRIIEANGHSITTYDDNESPLFSYISNITDNYIYLEININKSGAEDYTLTAYGNQVTEYNIGTSKLIPFDLTNIDDMRYDLLSHHTMGTAYVIDKTNKLPYRVLCDISNSGTLNQYPLNGLLLKTYQNDIFNNWLNSEWIEGENGINELSKVSVTDGAFSMDALSFAQKLYNMLNRIAVAGATYEDWQDAVYETVKRRQIESPIFLGGMSQEVMFDEIIQTAPGDGDPDGTGTLGTMGGRGSLQRKKKGGKIHVKCDEACFIIAIVSLTPRVFYTQGNEFYLTELESMDDLHKPALDGIGFQDLIGERMAWWDTKFDGDEISHRSKIGKLPAWIEYMTSVDKAYGDFALEYGKSSYTLNRNYEVSATGGIKDATTYVDPSKYNYAFAYTALESQNFWVMINFDIKARRLMSARLIPNV